MILSKTDHYVIVYQYGKVASTSLVASLNEISSITAVQSHFLGTENLKAMVGLLVDIDRPTYFFENDFEQFKWNLKITRDIHEFQAGRRAHEKLAIITLCREPLDWARSSVGQDIQGYIEPFQEVARHHGLDYTEEGEMIAKVLPEVLDVMVSAIRRVGGIDTFLNRGKPWNEVIPDVENQTLAHFFRTFLAMMLRPFDWFDTHFERALGIRLDSLETIAPNLLYGDKGWSEVFILRYEDISHSMAIVGQKLGIENSLALSKENVSSDKMFSNVVNEAFRGKASAELAKLYGDTRYSQFFGYGKDG